MDALPLFYGVLRLQAPGAWQGSDGGVLPVFPGRCGRVAACLVPAGAVVDVFSALVVVVYSNGQGVERGK